MLRAASCDVPLCCRQDPETNQPKGFGFCEFEDAEGVMRALGHLNNLSVDGSELLVKCNAATQKYIDDYKARKVCAGFRRLLRLAISLTLL